MNKRAIMKRIRRQAFEPYFGLRLAWRIKIPMSMFPIAYPEAPEYGGEELCDGMWIVRETPEGSEVVNISKVSGHKDHVPHDAMFVTPDPYFDDHVDWWEGTRTIWPGKVGEDRENAVTVNLPQSEVAAQRAKREWEETFIHGMHEVEMSPALASVISAMTDWPKTVYVLERTEEYLDLVISCKPNYAPYFASDMARAYRAATAVGTPLRTLRYGYDIQGKSTLRRSQGSGTNNWRRYPNPEAKAKSLAMRDWRRRRG